MWARRRARTLRRGWIWAAGCDFAQIARAPLRVMLGSPKFFPTNLKFGLARGRGFPYIIPCACGLSAVGSAPPCQGGGRGFEPRSPLHVSTEAGHSGLFHMAKWPSGKAGACKALTPGSNPGFASRK